MSKKQDKLTTKRNVDLEKALAEATRQLEIEAVLEKVRSRSLAMNKSDELLEVVTVVFEKLQELKFPVTSAGIHILVEGSKELDVYGCAQVENESGLISYRLPYFDHPIEQDIVSGWKKGLDFSVKTYSKKEKNSFYNYLFKHSELKGLSKEIKGVILQSHSYTLSMAFSKNSIISINDFQGKILSEKEADIIKRFSKVFEQACTRFLDLQKAELQAREVQIEASLERVRSKAMSMRNSGDLLAAASTVFIELQNLGVNQIRSGVGLIAKDFHNAKVYSATSANGAIDLSLMGEVILNGHPVFEQQYQSWLKLENYFVALEGKELASYYKILSAGLSAYQDFAVKKNQKEYGHWFMFPEGFLYAWSDKEYTDAEIKILERFKNVIGLTVRRYIELQKAEAQTREAQIELSLERVRASAMGMHKTDQLLDAAELLYRELTDLGINSMAVTYAIMAADEKNAAYYSINPVDGKINPVPLDLLHTETEVMRSILSSWKKQETISKLALDESATLKHQTFIAGKLQAFFSTHNFDYNFSVEAFLEVSPKKAVIYTFNFAQGYIFIIGSEHLTKVQEEMVMRFAKVFAMTYTRFLDLQKAEEQAREALIETALERVRSRTMGMQHTEELPEVVQVIYEQLVHLGFEINNSGILTDFRETDDFNLWMADPNTTFPTRITVPYIDHRQMNCFKEGKAKGRDFLTFSLTPEEKNKWFEYCLPILGVAEEAQKIVFDSSGLATSAALLKNVSLYLVNFSGVPYSDADNAILMRFGKVFEQTYTRFKDLEQAEAQAREADVQLALERVRARTMAMQRSNELSETAYVLYQQFASLGNKPLQITIGTIDAEKHVIEFWATDLEGHKTEKTAIGSLDEPFLLSKLYAAWKNKKKSAMFALSGRELKGWVKYREQISGLTGPDLEGTRYVYLGYFSKGAISISSEEPLPEETVQILGRFAQVFDGTYTRFLDLKKAEAQAREAQIELSLERVRAKTMAMHTSEHVGETVATMFDELVKLGIDSTARTGISIIGDNREMELWRASFNTKAEVEMLVGQVDMTIHPSLEEVYEAWKSKQVYYSYELTGEDQENYFQALNDSPHYAAQFDLAKLPPKQTNSVFFFPEGCVYVFTVNPLSEDEVKLFKRFAGVFGLTYRRYLDLQKAETQVRQARIEAALERVRSKTMAMHNSQGVGETVATMFDELVDLGIENTARCGILIIDETKHMEVWTAAYNAGGEVAMLVGRIDMMIHPLIQRLHQSWKDKLQTQTYELLGEDLKNYYRAINNSHDYPVQFDIDALPQQQFNNAFFFPEGAIFVFSLKPLPEQAAQIVKRFAGVFGLTYRRYLDLQKAENQAKESQIQLALERVRARTMAMQKSDELAETATVLFQQLINLGISSERTFIGMPDDETRKIELWGTEQGGHQMSMRFEYEADATYAFREIYKAWQEKRSELTVVLKGKNLDEHVNYVRDVLHMPLSVELVQKQRILYNAYFSKGLLMIVTPDTQSKETLKILQRFAAVFDGTYTRFLDLQKSETQGRESQIQLALERVRARTMAMQKSDELAETATVLFQQLLNLGISSERTVIAIPNEDTRKIEFWGTEQGGNQLSTRFEYDADATYAFRAIYKAWQEKRIELTVFLKGKNLEEHVNYVRDVLRMPMLAELVQEQRILYNVFFSKGWLEIITPRAQSNETLNILERFAAVFDGTYTRFLDLQKAETQGRESQIQLALERVRARTMAMQKSEELSEVIQLVFDQLQHLNFGIDLASFSLNYEETDDTDMWIASVGAKYVTKMQFPYINHPAFDNFNKAKKKAGLFADALSFEEKNGLFKHIFKYMRGVTAERMEFVFNTPGFARSMVFMNDTVLTIANYEGIPYSEAENKILLRFGQVFDQTYTRFNDLQLAEAQAREAIIEAALERVRGRALAMHNSVDLASTASMVFTELKRLGIRPLRCGVGLIDKESYDTTLYAATGADGEENLELMGRVSLSGHPVLVAVYNHWIENKEYFPELHGKSLKTYYEQLRLGFKVSGFQHGKKMHGNFIPFSEGCLYAWAEEPLGMQDIKILKRFTSVIDLTFKRFMELQRSEANARDAVREASLDRVRAEIASMRTRKDLERITPLMCEELATLGIPFIRCGVFIIDEKRELIHTYLSTPDGRALGAFDLTFDSEGIGRDVLPAWRKKQIALIHWNEEEFAAYTKNLVTQGTVNPGERYVTEHPNTSLDLHFLPFLQGMLYVGNGEPLLEKELSVVQSLAAAFSTAYARYEDFNRLEAAKEQVDHALTELKAAQNKLIQSEKMASLGELTAGIAHEIQNPLNFVNNFSEVNQEMIDELEEELKSGNIDNALAIAADIKQNEEKINHHGKRADAIVKGMLEHSRAGTSEKQPTNINVLADEFLKLSYHGLRAKDKMFNSDMTAHFDESLPKANVVQQDIGRVLINLFNNAFYAVNQKAKKATAGYKPAVEVSTSTTDGFIVIKVRDNGDGIPDNIKDKIMQPFFTTKPTGEGTGLGLSLSYDIVVKGHGGSITVDTKENEYTEFVITLPLN